MATLITGDWVVGFDGQNHVLIPDGVVIVDGDRVVHVGPTYDGTTERTIGGAGMLVSPGFIDVHVHAGTRTLHRLFSDSGRVVSLPFIPSCLPTTAWLSGTDIILSQWIL